jgi:hypothetical protein
MRYFQQLPKIVYTDPNTGIKSVTIDLLPRSSIIQTLLANPLLYYNYDVQEGDTPEIVADKYYGDSYRYWLILYANQMLDPQWSWPLSYAQFNVYMNDKYSNTDVYATVYEYQKIVTKYDANSQATTTDTFVIDENDYNLLFPYNTTVNTITGPVGIKVTKNAQSIYDYELQVNENKRNIQIINKLYANQIESEFKSLMGQ